VKFLLYAALIAAIFWIVRGMLRKDGAMTPVEAARILEVPADADADAINAAHRRLIAKVHPDTGGSAEIAARVNQARDVLLRRLGQ
jgi:DnaJ homolog subfamily C member 19